MSSPWVHNYVSTACLHAQHEDRPELHAGCRNTCKFAQRGQELCGCPCHGEAGTQPATGSPVDQARDLTAELLGVILLAGVDLDALVPDLSERLRTDPVLFWARGEAQPPGVWETAEHRPPKNTLWDAT